MAGSNIARQKNGTIVLVGSPALASNQTLIAAAATSVKIRVVWMIINCGGGANTVTFKSATTAISPAFSFADKGGMVLEYNPNGWMETAINETLSVTLANATLVGCQIGYVHSTV